MRREFVANVSHDLRTPLVSIRGFAETLKAGAIDDREHRLEFLETIEAEADRMTRLVDDLLQLASIESGKVPARLEALDPLESARAVLERLAPLASRRQVRLELAASSGPARVRADKGQLEQVFTNLVDNAIKFSPDGGRVLVSAAAAGGNVLLSVRDEGLGIPAEDLPRIFERFYRVDKARSRELGGTGLGLSIVKHIAEGHGGSVSVESSEGMGSTFTVSLPAVI